MMPGFPNNPFTGSMSGGQAVGESGDIGGNMSNQFGAVNFGPDNTQLLIIASVGLLAIYLLKR